MPKKDEVRILLELSIEEEKAMLIIKRGKSPDIAVWLSLDEVDRLKVLLTSFHYKLKGKK